ncbi:quinone-dependent dihydroorotate dehydrogenase [Salinisphaera aquimarina]|uniref:Dihydroorotate dehydrogenase (quinone) n=1 Tax=Salinisphaera aquimarina TaxID=2094031 RepID=A0ABV7ESE3_9GAMM
MYALARAGLFKVDPERAHRLTLGSLARTAAVARKVYGDRVPDAPVEVMGLRLANPIGLAAGMDKDGRCIDGLAALGFGFLELGTVTPVAQPGNDKPRMFRLVEQRALINRLGFNNGGVEALVRRIRAARYGGVLGINIGKNAKTPPEHAVDDYLACLRAVHEVASYITVNVSSPNTRGLRELQGAEHLDTLLAALTEERDRLADTHGRRVPLAVKIAPDLDDDQLDAIAERLLHHRIDAVIATNTTIARHKLPVRWWFQAGGLSGVPLRQRSTEIIVGLRRRLGDEVPIIGVGGIDSPQDAIQKLEAGANALQIYTGLIYHGPALIRECAIAAAHWQARQRVIMQASIVRRDRTQDGAGVRAAADEQTPPQ